MRLVILSGGSGIRLWPLSNDVRSKQFLKALRDANGKPESMIQRLWQQVKESGLRDVSFISTTAAHVELIHKQLGMDVPLIIEPQRRDTFPAIALAAAYLQSIVGVEPNEIITVMPVDPYVDTRFLTKIQALEQALIQSGADIGLLGVEPVYPTSRYGYIIPQLDDQGRATPEYDLYWKVKHFAEKPTEERARQLIAEKALWNCGVFAFSLGYILSQLKQRGLPTDYQEVVQHYDQLPKISFDYEVVEKADQVIVMPYDGTWKDLGTWDTLTEYIDRTVTGQGYLSSTCTNTHVWNELEIPVVVVGVSDVVVVASPDGILVADKASSHLVKEILNNLHFPQPGIEPKP